MRQAGFNTIKIWAQWRWNQPAEARFFFDDLDALMDLAEAHGLKVIINTILDCAPAWLFRKYPDCVMVTGDGRRIGPVTIPCRQIGGVPGPCFHHPDAMRHLEEFVAAVVARYAAHPALLAWDMWNEPELTVGMPREPRPENLTCYCDHSRQAFIAWLARKYGGVHALNARWQKNYQSWDEVELPARIGTFSDMVDWRLFFVDTLTQNMEKRAAIAREHDRVHPIMCHTVPAPHFNPITCASDDWALAKCCDLFGNSVGSDPMPADILRAAARGKTVINAEIHAIPGSTFSRPRPAGLEEMKRHILIPLAHGIKGFLYWQYRPELLGVEGPAWGLTFPDGSPAPWLEATSRICRELLSDSDFFLNAERVKPQVAIYTDPANQVFCWAASTNTKLCHDSLAGAYTALHRANFSIDFVHPSDVLSGVLSEHSILYMPLPYWIEPDVLEKIRTWVQSGGDLISECFMAGIDTVTGLHSKTTPGGGFDEVFGVREGITYPESGALDSYSGQVGDGPRGISMQTKQEIGVLGHESIVPGCQVGVSLLGEGVEVLARHPTGETAIAENRYGKGTATMIGTLLGAACVSKDRSACSDLLAGLAGKHCTRRLPEVTPHGSVRVDVLSHASKRWILIRNLTDEHIQASVRLPDPPRSAPAEMLGDGEALLEDGRIELTLLPRRLRAFWER